MNLNDLLKYASIVAACLFVAVATFHFFRVILHQNKLKKTLVLVKLKRSKIAYLILIPLFLTVAILFVVFACWVENAGFKAFYSATAVAFFTGTAIMMLSIFTKAALTSSGIFLFTKFIPWHKLYYYFIDENRCTVVVSSNDSEWMSFAGASLPLKFKQDDLDKVKIILSDNKSPFTQKKEL